MPIEALDKVAGILFGSGLTVLTACLLGRLLLAQLGSVAATLTRAESWIFGFALGAACLSNAVFLLCSMGWVYDPVLLTVAAVTGLLWWRWGRNLPATPTSTGNSKRELFWTVLLCAVGVAYGALYLVHGLAPEIRADAVDYHLGLVGRYYRDHGFSVIETNVYAYLSQGAEMLYLFAYSFGRHSAAKMVHLCFLFATVAAVLAFSRRFGVWRAGVVGALLYACSPVVGTDATSAYNDCALAFYQFLTFYGLVVWWRRRDTGWLWAVGVLAGFCFAIKYTGYLALPAAAAVLVWRELKDGARIPRVVRRVLIVSAAAALFVLPWTVKNAVLVGNPVAPFFNRLFPNPYVTAGWEDAYRKGQKHYAVTYPENRLVELMDAPLEVTVKGIRFRGLLGPIFLLAPLALLSWRHPLGKPLLGAAVIFATPWLSNAGTRFLIPSLVFVSLAMGLVLCRLSHRLAAAVGGALLLLHALASWPTLYTHWHPEAFWALPDISWQAALRLQPEREFLHRWVPRFTTAEILNAITSPNDRVLSLEPLPEAYTHAEIMVSYQGAINEELAHVLLAAREPDFWPKRRVRIRWSPQPLVGFRVVQENEHESSHWRMSEIQLFQDGRELAPSDDWRITAEPRPWTARRAFDGNPVTAWNSWQPLRPGMRIQAQFPEARVLDEAELIYTWEQYFINLNFFGQRPDGSWQPLDVESEETQREVSDAEMKAWVGEELKRHDVRFLVTNTAGGGHNLVAPLIDREPAAWGLREIGRDGPIRVYRVE